MNQFELTYKPFGERSILIEWPQIISKEVLDDVLLYRSKLEDYKFKEKVYIKSAYNSILISYKLTINNFYDKISTLKALESTKNKLIKSSLRIWKIPVCYELEFGIDLNELSTKNNMTVDEIIRLHTETIYSIYFLGFLPGFLYLGGLDDRLHFPRKKTPRLKIDKGSVAIGGIQTGIYPSESPGGWNIIGKTPISFFDALKDEPCFAEAGDKIQFSSISNEEYAKIKSNIANGDYFIESEVIYD